MGMCERREYTMVCKRRDLWECCPRVNLSGGREIRIPASRYVGCVGNCICPPAVAYDCITGLHSVPVGG